MGFFGVSLCSYSLIVLSYLLKHFRSVSFCHPENLKGNWGEMKNEAEKRSRILDNRNSPQRTQGTICSPTSCFTDCLIDTKVKKLIWSLAVVSHPQITWSTKTSWKKIVYVGTSFTWHFNTLYVFVWKVPLLLSF